MNDIAETARALRAGTCTAEQLLRAAEQKIDAREADHNAVICQNPDAHAAAIAFDRHNQQDTPLAGIPILVKDNLDSGDAMPTTAGSLALASGRASTDSAVVAKLRAAGAILLGKTNLSEWANFRSTRSSSGWSSAGGQTRNAHDPARTPGGSSSGSAVAVALGYARAAIGTETDGSIVGPAAMNGVVGIKPTVGLVSQAGIIPISRSQDTAGPIARNVRDAATVLSAIATRAGTPDYAAGLEASTLRGARLGVARNYTGIHDRVDVVFEAALAELSAAGAIIVDELEAPHGEALRADERFVMETEFRVGLREYLATRDADVSVRTLEDLIEFNARHEQDVLKYFGQELLIASQQRGELDSSVYRRALARCRYTTRADGIDRLLQDHNLDALIAPTQTVPWLIDWHGGDNRRQSFSMPAAIAGYPHVTVPMGMVEHLPVGLSFVAGAWQEQCVINFAHAFEQRNPKRVTDLTE